MVTGVIRILADTGSPRTVGGRRAYTDYCNAVGQGEALQDAEPHMKPPVWGSPLEILGVGTLGIIFEDLELRIPVIVVEGELPLLLGDDDQEKYGINLIRRPPPRRLTYRGRSLPLRKEGHIFFEVPKQSSAVFFDAGDLMKLHKRFGHAPVEKVLKLIRMSGDGEGINTEDVAKVKELVRNCPVCQWYCGKRSSYKVAVDVSVEFNHVLQADFFKISIGDADTRVLHMVCSGTKYNVAVRCPSDATAQVVFACIYRAWITHFGAPHRLKVDQEGVLVSDVLKIMLSNECCILDPVPIEAHHTMGLDERYYEILRKVCLRVAREHPALGVDDVLAIAQRCVNTTSGPQNIIPALLVFGTISRLQVDATVAAHDSREDQEVRISAMMIARKEYEVLVSRIKLKQAEASRAPEFPRYSDVILQMKAVLVRRDDAYEWQGPMVVIAVDGVNVTIVRPSGIRARARQEKYHINNVKLYRGEQNTLLMEQPDDVELFKESDRTEIKGLLDRKVFEPIGPTPATNDISAAGSTMTLCIARIFLSLKSSDPCADKSCTWPMGLDRMCWVQLQFFSQVTAETMTADNWKSLRRIANFLYKHPRQIRYPQLNNGKLRLRAYADAPYAKNQDGSSQSGVAIFLGDNAEVHFIHATSNKSRRVVSSILSAELLPLCAAYDYAEALRHEIQETGIPIRIVLYTDSKQIFDALTHNTTLEEKRMMVRLMLVREGVEAGDISEIVRVPGACNLADAQTKEKIGCPLWAQMMNDGTISDDFAERVFLCD